MIKTSHIYEIVYITFPIKAIKGVIKNSYINIYIILK